MFSSLTTSSKAADATTASMCAMKLCHGSKWSLPDHEDWCTQTTRNPIILTVSDPETKGSLLKKHTTYAVRQDNNNLTVRRRFSDFEWLQSTLAARYIGMVIPSLPEKNVYKTESFIRSRMRGLTIFLNQMMRSPYLRQDTSVVGFLTVLDDGEWDQVKKSTSVMENAGGGHLRWMQCLLNTDVPEDTEKFVVGIKRDVEQVEKVCMDIALCTKRLGDKCASLSKDVSEMHLLFNQWKNIEFNACDDKHEQLNAMLSTSTTMMGGWHDVHYHQPIVHDLMLHEGLKYIALQVKDFKEILKLRDSTIMQFEKNKQQALSPQKANSIFARVEPTAAELEASAYRYEHTIGCINRALFFSEAKRLKALKTELLRETMGLFACAEYQVAKRMASMWSGFLAASEIDQKVARILHVPPLIPSFLQEMMLAAKGVLDAADAKVEAVEIEN
ncbi:Aste57867_13242 [Aphanomyces stellatus]|uniref:Aste57867_13242 protein n=1 Tax=Aphanomyces stellatus TaxID=120398 RepID=A0A485KYH9_9STRA|nr:hypothetical protein As57867_013193 [Aphanomyces stellatus]VFT90082.1 Aste57867_13242 [Aphanomyces stellatus]